MNSTVIDPSGNHKFSELVYKYKTENDTFEFFSDGSEDVEIFEKELSSINELLDIEDDDIVQVLLRKAQILEVLVYSAPNTSFDEIIQCYNNLRAKDPRHVAFYEESLAAYNSLKLKRKNEAEVTSLKLKAKLLVLE